jgi:hypothetical protein
MVFRVAQARLLLPEVGPQSVSRIFSLSFFSLLHSDLEIYGILMTREFHH